MKSITAALLSIVATTLVLKGVAAAALPEPQTVTFSDGDSIHFAGKRVQTIPVLARIADFIKRHPKDIGIVAKAEEVEDCAPCDFYVRDVEEPAKREIELVKESEDLEDCAAPCDFYIRDVEEPAKREVELVKESDDLEDCAAPCDFYIRSEESADIVIHPLPVGPSEGSDLPVKRDELLKKSEDAEDCAAPCDFYIRSVDEEGAADDDLATLWLAKKAEDIADEEECAAPCDFYIRSVDEEAIADDELTSLWLTKKSEDVADEEECAAPCDFYIH